jgi:uncharacterized membrane protein YkoI
MLVRLSRLLAIAGMAILVGTAAPVVAQDEPYVPDIDPANFVAEINNPYLPFIPGTTTVFEGETEEGSEHQETTVLHETRDIQGITATVVRDTVWLDGALKEDTYDWYAQDKDGNVWYLGEDTREYENGEVVSTEGSWEYGVDGALPGIMMPGTPQVGDTFREEYYAGEAEDSGEVTSLSETASVQYGDFSNVVVIRERTPLEPDILEDKYYAAGVGLIMEQMVEGGSDHSELVNVYTWDNASEDGDADTENEASSDENEGDDAGEDADEAGDVDATDDDEGADEAGDAGETEDDADENEQAIPQPPLISAEQALSAAQAANPDAGFTEVELEFENGTWIYSAESGEVELEIDAITGDVMGDSAEDN